jgi:hypothetical protein
VKRDFFERLLGAGDRDPGCEGCFEEFDAYAEAVLRGEPVEDRFPRVVAHLAGCTACREDAEGILAALRRDPPDDSR